MNRGFSDSALVLIGHGSTLNPDSSTPTQAHARVIRERGIFHEVHSCFWKEEPSLREVLRMVESETVYAVPVFISEGYFTRVVIPRELELTGRGPFSRRADNSLLRTGRKSPPNDRRAPSASPERCSERATGSDEPFHRGTWHRTQ